MGENPNDSDGPFNMHRARKPDTHRNKTIYNTARWQRLRRMKLNADPVCESCHEALAVDVDHENSNAEDMRWSNLKSLCKRCHGVKTKATTS